jgi:uncharacterized protein YqeY
MSLQKQIMEELKMAMKSKDVVALQALRAVKSAFLLANNVRIVLQFLLNKADKI